MKLIKTLAATAALVSFAGMAQAQDSGLYANGGIEILDAQGASGNVVGRLGYNISQYFAVEGEASVGVLEDNDDFKLDYKIAGFGKVKAPIGEQFEIFGRLGYYYAEAEGGDGDDIAWGGGVEYFFSPAKTNSVRLDYTALEVGEGFNADIYSITYGIRF